jgi:solute carrier family 25 carnitine/acylcarnitine transporter 20/29
MQAQKGYTTGSAFSALMHTVKADGILALYRGCIPPLLGTFFLRSVQFGGYELGEWHLKYYLYALILI